MRLTISFIVITLLSSLSVAQTKVGTIDNEYIIGIMPEAKRVVELAQEYGKRLDSSFQIKVNDYKAKAKYIQDNEKTLKALEKKMKINELISLEEDIKKYEQNGSQLMSLKQNELMRPLYKKLNDAISAVAKENGYSQILTLNGNQLLYIDDTYDITKLVIKKLNLKEPTN